METETIKITTKPRKLTAKWTVEAMEDYELHWDPALERTLVEAIHAENFDRAREALDG